MSLNFDLQSVLSEFGIESQIKSYGNGHINDTFCTEDSEYILQKINTEIFTNPYELMENIDNVTSFLKNKIKECGGDPDRETLTVIKTKDGQKCFKASNGFTYRVYKFINNTKTVENDVSLGDVFNAGVGFGKFQRMLNDFPVELLYETIKDFHNTPKRFKDFLNDTSNNINDPTEQALFATRMQSLKKLLKMIWQEGYQW